jgi:26S proteasome regulatory subunit N7
MAFKGEDELPKSVILDLAEHLFLLQSTAGASEETKAEAHTKVMGIIAEHSMSKYYQHVASVLNFTPDEKLVSEMAAKNETELKDIEEKIADAKENLGDTEVRDFLLQKAEFFSRIGDKVSVAIVLGFDKQHPYRMSHLKHMMRL